MLKGFREFVFRGNIIDLAVAFVVAAAVAALVKTFSDSLILPIVGIFLGGGAVAGTWEINGQVIDYGAMITALVTFFITLAVLYFIFIVPMNRIRSKMGKDTIDATPADIALLQEIRDLLKERQMP